MSRIIPIAAILFAGGLSGCASPPPPAGGLSTVLGHYDSREYQQAYDGAIELMRDGEESSRPAAAYVAGLSAYQLGHHHEADLRLRIAAESGDDGVAAKADAMLGVVRLEEGRFDEAERLLRDASAQLEGDDLWHATRLADAAERQDGYRSRSTMQPASSARASANYVASASSHGAAAYTLQAGAFRERDRAQAVANEVAGTLGTGATDPVQIVDTRDRRGRPLHLVHVGAFATRGDAVLFRLKLGREHYVVAPIRQDPHGRAVRIR